MMILSITHNSSSNRPTNDRISVADHKIVKPQAVPEHAGDLPQAVPGTPGYANVPSG